MKRFCVIFFVMMGLCACAGNPPEWWNPGKRYGQTDKTSAQSDQQNSALSGNISVKEETLDPLPDNSYEEETISPLPEEEDTPAASAPAEPALEDALPAPSVLE